MKKKTLTTPNLEKASNSDGLESAVGHAAQAIVIAGESIAEKLPEDHHFEQIAEYLGELASALHAVAHARAMSVIAQYGSNEDRTRAVTYLKGWFSDEFRE